mmetsp:Transcript_5698/g.12350  ORF Transcript_5698/g.12350 Transcript_5698/m.12350 type:complete len:98 (+) Transcript_5698:77-370(+)
MGLPRRSNAALAVTCYLVLDSVEQLFACDRELECFSVSADSFSMLLVSSSPASKSVQYIGSDTNELMSTGGMDGRDLDRRAVFYFLFFFFLAMVAVS